MYTMLALCVLNDYVSFYNVIFIIYLPLKVSSRAVIPNPRPRGREIFSENLYMQIFIYNFGQIIKSVTSLK